MKFGAHVSIAGGIDQAPLRAAAIGCETFQSFSRSPQGGPAPKLTPEIVEAFLRNCREANLSDWVIHAPYYLNFASENEKTRANSARIVREELERASLLQTRYVMFHPGSAKDSDEKQALQHCIDGISRVLDGYSGSAKLLIEISAGAGMVVGDTFDEVAAMLDGVDNPELGVCFDTAHAFAAGYDLRTPDALKKTLKEFDTHIGLDRLKMSHCNDSKVDLGMKRDRHEHLGKGFIGLGGFESILESSEFKNVDLYLETEPEGVAEDLKILKKLRGPSTPTKSSQQKAR